VKLADVPGTKRKEYMKAKIEELETNSKIKKVPETCVRASLT
jgi:hypothetical protein